MSESSTTRSIISSIKRYTGYPAVKVDSWIGYHVLGQNFVEIFTVEEVVESETNPLLVTYDIDSDMVTGILTFDTFCRLSGHKLIGYDKQAHEFVGFVSEKREPAMSAIAALDQIFFIGSFSTEVEGQTKQFQFVRGETKFSWGEIVLEPTAA